MQTNHRVIFEDARKISALNDQSIDLVVTSPPYPMIEMWDQSFAGMNSRVYDSLERGEYGRAFKAMHEVLDQIWGELFRVMKDGAFACINIGDATRTNNGRFQLFANHSRVQKKFFDLGFVVLPLILWRKQTNAPNKFMGSGMLPAGAYVTLEHEYILIFRKGSKRKFSTAEEKLKRMQSGYFWEERNTWFSDLWDFKGARQDTDSKNLRERSGAFPLMLPFRLINMYSLMGDFVLDPFFGTGTTAMAAMAAGRNSVGCEIDPGFVEPVKQRIFEQWHLLNRYNLDRIKNHLNFVKKHEIEGNQLKYMNSYFGFPVMTRQEKELKFPFIMSVAEEGTGCFKTVYFDDQYIKNIKPEKLDIKHLTYDHGVQTRLF
ncbi:MAG: site-specific DNA-methyltransferase [Bacillota bacterium]